MEESYCVYIHTFPNGKKYVGQTKQNPEYRWNKGEGYKGQPYMYNAIRKYGWENIKHEVIIFNISRKEADKWEDTLIALHRTNEKEYGYNLRSGGTSGYEYTEEVKAKMSERLIGRKQSEETRRRHSEALTRYYSTHKVSDETKEKLRKANLGKSRPLTEEQRKRAIQNIEPHQFKKGHAPNKKSIQTIKERYSKKVIQYDIHGNKIAEYSSIVEASIKNNLTKNAVGNCVRGYTFTTNGYLWRYADDILDITQIDKNKLEKSLRTRNQSSWLHDGDKPNGNKPTVP